jgi:hypothetical protein
VEFAAKTGGTLTMARRFRIHPSIGVARVGNSPDEFFIGPETPGRPANWGNGRFDSFRDAQGRIKRQAARFRIFEYDESDGGELSNPREIAVGDKVTAIEWRVHLANRKGSFFTFNGQSGWTDLYQSRAARAAEAPEKADKAAAKDQGKEKQLDPPRPNLRNANVSPAERTARLDLDAGERMISTMNPQTVVLTHSNASVPFIPDLGELRMDGSRLLVLGGHGTSGSTENPPRIIDEYANNDTWFDDVSDGPIKARIRLADATVVDADAAWVLVGPPDFAPGIGNAVTLYDTLWDLSVRELEVPKNALFNAGPLSRLLAQKAAWAASHGTSLAGYTVSFLEDVFPLLWRAFGARWVFDPGEMDRASFHVGMFDWPRLSDNSPAARPLRRGVLSRMRDPNANEIDWRGMPRGLGDDYDHLDDDPPAATGLLRLNRVQYALLQQWADGAFDTHGWTGAPPAIPNEAPASPNGLDQAAVENCVGGPFYPGIEVSWLVRVKDLYLEPFRLRAPNEPAEEAPVSFTVGALRFGPGFFSQQMAQPWQADFYDCHKEEREGTDQSLRFYMWWTAQRPDDVYPAGVRGVGNQVPWTRRFKPAEMDFDEFEGTDERFRKMQQEWHALRFIVQAADETFEEES